MCFVRASHVLHMCVKASVKVTGVKHPTIHIYTTNKLETVVNMFYG